MLGERMPDNVVLFMARRGADYIAGRVQHPRPRHDLRPQLGRPPRIPLSAFRVLLLPGDRVRDRPRAEAGRGRRARARTNCSAAICRCRPTARTGSPIPASAAPSPLSRPRARDGRAEDRAPRRILALPPRRRTERGEGLAEIASSRCSRNVGPFIDLASVGSNLAENGFNPGQGQRLQIGALGQCGVDRVVGAGAATAQDAAAAPGIGETVPHRVGELRGADIVRARGDEQKPAGRGQLRREPRQLAIAAQAPPARRASRARKAADRR